MPAVRAALELDDYNLVGIVQRVEGMLVGEVCGGAEAAEFAEAALPREKLVAVARELVAALYSMRSTLAECGLPITDYADLFHRVDRKSEEITLHAFGLNGHGSPLRDADFPADLRKDIDRLSACLAQQPCLAAWELPAIQKRAFDRLQLVVQEHFTGSRT